MPQYLIYALQCPLTQEIRYIGRSVSGRHRIIRHWVPSELAKDTNTHKRRWISKLRRYGLKPNIIVVQSFVDATHLDSAEIYWIDYFRNQGAPLVNILAGGSSRAIINPETKARWNAALRVAASKVETKQKQSASLKKFYSENPEERKKLIARLTAHANTPEAKDKLAKTMEARWADPEYKAEVAAKISAARKGKPVAESSRLGLKKSSESRRQPIVAVNIQTGERRTFSSKTEAAEALQTQVTSINHVLRGKHQQSKGWTFYAAVESA